MPGRRYYNPTLGRWITPDPKGFEDGPNLYAYLYNNPLTGFDLYGLSFTDFLKGFGTATLDLAFPSITTFYNLPQDTPTWTYAAVGAWVIADVALAALPAAKLTSMGMRSTTLLSKQVSKAVTRRSLARTAGKVEGVSAATKIIKPTRKTPRFIAGTTVRDKFTGRVFEGTVDLQPTLNRIKSGKPFPHCRDGGIYQNRRMRLPQRSPKYYREYVHPTLSVNGPGPQRIVTGRLGEIYYTPDHYATFTHINPWK